MKSNFKRVKLPTITYLRSEERYVTTIPKKYTGDGKRKKVYGKTEAEVREKFYDTLGRLDESQTPTLRAYMEYVLKSYKWKVREATTYDRYEAIYLTYIKDSNIGKMDIRKVDSADITSFLKGMANMKYSESTVKAMEIVLKTTFLRAKEAKIVDENIMDYVEISYRNCKRKNPFKCKEVFTINELERIETAIKSGWENGRKYLYSPMFLIMAYTGLRVGEILALQWQDIDFSRNIIYINKQVVTIWNRNKNGDKTHKTQIVKSPKSESSIRSIILIDKAKFWILELKHHYECLKINTPNVICNRKKKTPTMNDIYNVLKIVLSNAGVEYASSHKFRKTFASLSIENGVSISKVSAMLGHSNPAITMKSYARPTENNSDEIVRDKLNELYH